ncbi:hypothetical protein VTK73DRAFT_967 [Phialemonium thermophilum]|uniref:Uncharacterized protein n=1 Tax=Phialemonium thermophilum TaxID=223376 RepID=A0ABR3VU41_9PEZI
MVVDDGEGGMVEQLGRLVAGGCVAAVVLTGHPWVQGHQRACAYGTRSSEKASVPAFEDGSNPFHRAGRIPQPGRRGVSRLIYVTARRGVSCLIYLIYMTAQALCDTTRCTLTEGVAWNLGLGVPRSGTDEESFRPQVPASPSSPSRRYPR